MLERMYTNSLQPVTGLIDSALTLSVCTCEL